MEKYLKRRMRAPNTGRLKDKIFTFKIIPIELLSIKKLLPATF